MARAASALSLAALFALALPPAVSAQSVPPAAAEIRQEALRSSNGDPAGRPLPLAAHWNTGEGSNGFDPTYQVDLIRAGHHILPWFPGPGVYLFDRPDAFWQGPLQQLRTWNVPFSLIGPQWEHPLSWDDRYWTLPFPQNPNVVTPSNTLQRMVDPFGPPSPWTSVGLEKARDPFVVKMQGWYPDPKLLLLISNNEHPKLEWYQLETDRGSKRYLDLYGSGQSDEFKRQKVVEGWQKLYSAMTQGMASGFSSALWAQNARFVGYDAFGPARFAMFDFWRNYSLVTSTRPVPQHLYWHGGSPSYYLWDFDETSDFKVFSPQIESMNWVFMLERVYLEKPDFWFELSVWDGRPAKEAKYQSIGQTLTPQRYKGFVQFGMWLLTPRAIREYRFSNETRAVHEPYFMAILDAIKRVWDDPVLTKFWRKGALVANAARQHPFQSNVPAEYASEPRWFLLDTNLDPPRPWNLDTEIPVFSLARVLGDPPNREWLVYAHSPRGDRTNVRLTVPGYKTVVVDVPVSGAFYRFYETAPSQDNRPVQPSGVKVF